MTRLTLGTVFLLASFCMASSLLAQVAPAPAPAAATADPEFSRDSGKQSFSEAKDLFARQKYKEAERLFKKAKVDAKGKADKLQVERWALASTGGLVLEKLKKVKYPTKLNAYDQIQEYRTKYRGTPAEELYQAHLKTLEPLIFVVLENFSVASARYSPKFGKTFIKNPALSLDGTQFLRWTNTQQRKASALKISLPSPTHRNWGPFESIEFWINVKLPPRGIKAVVMCGAPAAGAAKAAPGAVQEYLYAPIPMPPRPGEWKRVRLNLVQMKSFGKPQLSSVQSFQFQIPAGSQYDFMIDQVALIRREKPTARGR